jgi:hypothetical protein
LVLHVPGIRADPPTPVDYIQLGNDL